MKYLKYSWSTLLVLIGIYSCATLNTILNQMNVQKPTVEITNAQISDLSYDDLNLLFDIQIKNPNTVGINLAGFDYELLINEMNSRGYNHKSHLDKRKATGKSNQDVFIDDPLKQITILKNKKYDCKI